jgi:4-hydroxy-tetrahydrodipicolinate synthase
MLRYGIKKFERSKGGIMNTDFVKGLVVPILTPVDRNEKIDETAMRRMENYVIRGGVDDILLYGSNG